MKSPPGNKDNKAEFRAAALGARAAAAAGAAVTGDGECSGVSELSAACARELAGLDEIRQARVVATYAAYRDELDPNGFVDLLEGESEEPPPLLVFPRVCGERELALHQVAFDELTPGAYGILEPCEAHPEVQLADIDVMLIPGVAFDLRGGRMGYGGGYYDSLLAKTDPTPATCRGNKRTGNRPFLVGVSYDETLFDELPIEDHDIAMDIVVTPTRVVACGVSR